MATTDTLVTEVAGPNGTAKVLEVPELLAGGGQRFNYAVEFKGKRDMYKSMGEAYIVAGELSGTKT